MSVANGQVNADPDRGRYCNPYGPCEEWCALFATWVWERAGVPIPSYPFTGEHLHLGGRPHRGAPADRAPVPGDAVLYGTGPWSTASSVHVGLVMQVWPDGAIVTIEGDAGPAPSGSLAVVVNGPYLPSSRRTYNGSPVYAFAVLTPLPTAGTDRALQKAATDRPAPDSGRRSTRAVEHTLAVVGGRPPRLGQGPGPLEEQMEVALPRVADGAVDLEGHPCRLGGGVRRVGLGHGRRPRGVGSPSSSDQAAA